MATAEYTKAVADNNTAFTHTIDAGNAGVVIMCDRVYVGLSLQFQPTGTTRPYPVTIAADGGLAPGQNAAWSTIFSVGGTLTITPISIKTGVDCHIAVVEL